MNKNLTIKAVKIIVTLILLLYIFYKVNYKNIFQAISSAKTTYLLLGYSIGMFLPFLNSVHFRILMKAHNISITTLNIFKINLVTSFYGLLFAGSISKPIVNYYKLTRLDENKKTEILGSMAFSKIISLVNLMIIAIALWIITSDSNNIINYSILTIFIGLIILTGAFSFIILQNKGLNKLMHRLSKIKFLKNKYFEMFFDKAFSPLTIYKLLSRKELFYLNIITTIRLFIALFTVYLFAMALNIEISFIKLSLVRSINAIVTAIPVTVGGFGVRESSLLVLLEPYIHDSSKIVALSFLIFTRRFIIGMIGGVLELVENLISRVGASKTPGRLS